MKSQSSQWKTKFSPRPKKTRQVRSNIKTMLIVFFDIEGIVYYEFEPHGQTVNQVFYKDVLTDEKKFVKNAQKIANRNLVSSPRQCPSPAVHLALSTREFLADKKISVVPHPRYSPALAPCDFFLFPKLKFAIKGQRFQDVEEIKVGSKTQGLNFRTVPKKFRKIVRTLGLLHFIQTRVL